MSYNGNLGYEGGVILGEWKLLHHAGRRVTQLALSALLYFRNCMCDFSPHPPRLNFRCIGCIL